MVEPKWRSLHLACWPTSLDKEIPVTTLQAPRHDVRRDGRASRAIALVLVVQLMLVLDGTIVNVALPRIGSALDMNAASLSWVLNAYALGFGGLLLLGGRLGDAFGRRRMFELGVGIFTVSSLIGGLAPEAEWLIAARALQGVGAALAAPSVLALIATSSQDPAVRRRHLALFSAVGVGGGSLGLILGGLLTGAGSWRWTLFINVPFGLVVLALTRRVLDELPRRLGRFDVVGAAAATGAAVAAVWALVEVPEKGWTSLLVMALFAVAGLLLVVLAVTEGSVPDPLVRVELLRQPRRAAALAAAMLVMGGQMATLFFVIQYVQRVLGYGPLVSGAAVLPMTVAIFGISRVVPQLVGRYGQGPLIVVGTFGLALSYVWFGMLGDSSGLVTGVLLSMLLNGLAAGLCFMPIASVVLDGVPAEHAGGASGLLQTSQQLGGAVGLAVVVSVFAGYGTPGDFVSGLLEAFLAGTSFALLALIVVAAAWWRTRARS
jgi:EmrB/QacA subfamily drug resistance transporter